MVSVMKIYKDLGGYPGDWVMWNELTNDEKKVINVERFLTFRWKSIPFYRDDVAVRMKDYVFQRLLS